MKFETSQIVDDSKLSVAMERATARKSFCPPAELSGIRGHVAVAGRIDRAYEGLTNIQ